MAAVDPLPLFVYGTLQDADVLLRVLARAAMPGQCVRLADHAAFTVVGERFPVLRRVVGAQVPGRLLVGLDSRDLHRLGWFEGGEFRLVDCSVIDAGRQRPMAARRYDDDGRFFAGDERWCLQRWQRVEKSAFLDDVDRRMDGYDAARQADRPR